MDELTEQDEADLAGRCVFCGAQLESGQKTCPQCDHAVGEGYVFRLRRPLWIRVLIWMLLLLFASALIVWVVNLIGLGLG